MTLDNMPLDKMSCCHFLVLIGTFFHLENHSIGGQTLVSWLNRVFNSKIGRFSRQQRANETYKMRTS